MDCAVSALLPITLLQCGWEMGKYSRMAWLLLKFTATFTSYDRDKSGFKLLNSFLQAVSKQCPCRRVPRHLEFGKQVRELQGFCLIRILFQFQQNKTFVNGWLFLNTFKSNKQRQVQRQDFISPFFPFLPCYRYESRWHFMPKKNLVLNVYSSAKRVSTEATEVLMMFWRKT